MNRTGKGTENLHMTSGVIPVSRKRKWAALLWIILFAALLIHGIAKRGGLNMDQRLLSTRNIVQVPVNAENVGSTVITGKGWNTSSISVRVRIPETADITEDSQLELTLFETDGTMLTDSYAPIPEDTTDAVVNITLSPSPVMLEKGTPYQLVLSVTSGTVNVCCSAETSDILYVMHADSLAEKLYLKGILTVILILMAIQGILLLYELLRGSRFFILLSLTGFVMNTLASQYVSDHILESSRGTKTALFLIFLLTMESILLLVFPVGRIWLPISHDREMYLSMLVMLFAAGLSFLLIIPLGEVPDEQLHFYRAYEISCGGFIPKQLAENSVGDVLPSALARYEDASAVIDWNDTSSFDFSNTAQYSPVGYLPQAVGIRAARIFSDSPSSLFLAARIGNFLCNFLLCALALWLLPFGQELFFLIMMFPMTLQEMVSVSVDGGTTATVFLYLALLFHLRERSKQWPVPWTGIAALSFLGIAIALEKFVYVVVVLLVLLLPGLKLSDLFGARRNKRVAGGASAAPGSSSSGIPATGITGNPSAASPNYRFGVSSFASWVRLVSAVFLPASALVLWGEAVSGLSGETYLGVDTPAQVKFVLHDPIQFGWILLRTLSEYFDEWSSELIGNSMGWLNIRISALSWLPLLLILVLIAARGQLCNRYRHPGCMEFPAFTRRERYILLLPVLTGILLINAGMYANWTEVGFFRVEGIQARYFQPLLPLGVIWFISEREALLSLPHRTDSAIRDFTAADFAPVIILFCDIIAAVDLCEYFLY